MTLAALIPLAVTTSVVLLVIGIGLHTRAHDVLSLFRRPGLLVRSVVAMIVVMPLVAVGLALLFQMPVGVKVALVALAVSPVPPLLPRKERKAVGDASYGLGLSVTVAVLAVLTVPLTASWLGNVFDHANSIGPFTVGKLVLITVLLPLAVGVALQRWVPRLAAMLARPLSIFGIVLLVISALLLLFVGWPAILALIDGGAALGIAAMAIIGLAVGHLLGGPDPDDRTVLALSTATRHPAVALAVTAAGGVATKPALAAILVYMTIAILVSIPYLAWRKRAADRDLAASASARVST